MSLVGTLKFIIGHPLNRDRQITSVIRFAKWQLGSRLVPGAVIFDWINGAKFMVRRGETGLTGNIYTGLHEFPDMGFLLHMLRPEDLFVDVGANAGSYTILACGAIGARGLAFEPVPSTYARLVENIRLNHLEERVVADSRGVGAERGTVAFTSDGDSVNHALAANESSANAVNVELTTLDDALRDESPVLMKIDVEGYETPALEGAQETLANASLRAVIMELNGSGERYGYDESHILEMVLDHGFKTYAYDPLQRTLADLDGKNVESGNTLFIRNKAWVKERVMTAPEVCVNGRRF